MKKVLVLCTGNSCRSIMAEALINHELGRFDIKAYSSGVAPSGTVNPNALKALSDNGISTDGLRSKNLSEFDGMEFDLVVTVCDHANETCPAFFGSAKKIHSGFIDPSGKEFDEYVKTLNEIRQTLVPLVKFELFGKTIKDSATAIQLDDGVRIEIQEGNEEALKAMVANCAEGKCDCMSKETKAKISGMEFVKTDNKMAIEIKGFVTKQEIEEAMSNSSAKCC